MPKIDIQRQHHLPLPEARKVINGLAASMREKFGAEGQWDGDTYRFKRSGISGAIALTARDVRVSADLGLMLSPLKGTIEGEIRRKLDEHFA